MSFKYEIYSTGEFSPQNNLHHQIIQRYKIVKNMWQNFFADVIFQYEFLKESLIRIQKTPQVVENN